MLENLTAEIPKPRCRVRELYETLEPADSKLLRQYVDDHVGWKHGTLSTALRERGVVIDPKVIKRHRDKYCSCER